MKVTMSKFLQNKRPALKKLVDMLSKDFGYASILGTDTYGKTYSVHKTGVSINDSRWGERGFVVRIHNGINYSEFSFNEIDEDNLEKIVGEINLKLGDVLLKLKNHVRVNPYEIIREEEITDSFIGEVKVLPSDVSPGEKLRRLTEIKDRALKSSELLADFRVQYEEVHVSKVFISTKKDLEQSYIWSQGYEFAIVRRNDNTKYAYGGFSGLKAVELIDEMEAKSVSIVKKAEKLLDAKPVEPGEYDVICSPEIAGLIAHEAFGHGVEMDMFVKNRAKAVEYLGKEVASSHVTMHDGAASAKDVSSYLFDDEGTLGSDTIIIKNGVLQTGISDILSALRLGTKPTGNGKRESFERKAYARMTNTFFKDGQDKLDDMIASIKHGYLVDKTMSGMEDPKNWGIQCIALYGEEIVDGKLTGNLISPVIMTGYVPDLLKSISMVSEGVELSGTGACGKGHKEWAKVSDGGPYLKARVRLG